MASKPKDPGPSQADMAQVAVAGHQWNDYMTRFAPAEAELVKRSEFTAGERARVRGEVAADTATAFKGLARKTVSASGQAGQNLASGATKLGLAGNALAQGEATGVGRAAAELGGRLESESEKFRVSQIGRNIVSDIQSDLSKTARRQTQASLEKAMLKAQAQNQKIAAAATIMGAGVRKYGLMQEDKPIEEIDTSDFPSLRVTEDPGFQVIGEDLFSGGLDSPLADNLWHQTLNTKGWT